MYKNEKLLSPDNSCSNYTRTFSGVLFFQTQRKFLISPRRSTVGAVSFWSPAVFVVCNGATENARPENAERSKMQGRKMQDWKLRDQYASVENAGRSSMESLFANKCVEAYC